MGTVGEIQRVVQSGSRLFRPGTPAEEYLRSRGYSFSSAKSLGIGFYRGRTCVPIETKSLWACLKNWGEDKPAILFPLRTFGGEVLGFQLGALSRGDYKDYFAPGAGKRGLFFYPDTFDWESFQQHGKLLLVEGCLDACALSVFCRCVVSTLSAKVTKGQSRVIKRWCDSVYCAFDNDEAGDRAAEKVEHFWDCPSIPIQRVRPLRKDAQAMYEFSPTALLDWLRYAVPRELLREVPLTC